MMKKKKIHNFMSKKGLFTSLMLNIVLKKNFTYTTVASIMVGGNWEVPGGGKPTGIRHRSPPQGVI